MKFSGKERDVVESELDYFGARYYASCFYRWLSTDPVINRQEAPANPQLWNLYAFCRNNPAIYFDPDGREVIRYHDPKLQKLVEALAIKSKMIRDTIALYQGEGTPDLDIKYGDAGMEDGNKAEGNFNGPPAMDGFTGEFHLLKGEITIDTSIKKRGRETKKVLRHEFGHADQAVRDPGKSDAEYKKGLEMKYEDRPVEKYANEYARQSKKRKK